MSLDDWCPGFQRYKITESSHFAGWFHSSYFIQVNFNSIRNLWYTLHKTSVIFLWINKETIWSMQACMFSNYTCNLKTTNCFISFFNSPRLPFLVFLHNSNQHNLISILKYYCVWNDKTACVFSFEAQFIFKIGFGFLQTSSKLSSKDQENKLLFLSIKNCK